MIINLTFGILIANLPNMNVTNLFLFYGTLRASTFAPTVLTLLGKRLRHVALGVVVSLIAGLPIFAWGMSANLPMIKVAGSLIALTASGVIALFPGGKNVR
jgi:hypothetical protein